MGPINGRAGGDGKTPTWGAGVDTQGSVAHGTKPVLGIGGQRQSSDIQEQCQEELASVQYSGRKRLYKLIRGVREET